MKFFSSRSLFFSLLLSFLVAPSAFAWSCKGHQTAALIAEKHLTPAAKQLADSLLAIDPQRPVSTIFACGTQGLDLFAASSTWADAERQSGVDDGWHYVDIPRGAGAEAIAAICAQQPSCITDALTNQIKIIKDTHADPKLRAAAVRFIIHFAGDIHQPLHCTNNGDRGGNCVPVTYFKTKPHSRKDSSDKDSYSPNLHGIWDKEIVEADMKARNAATAQAYADLLDSEFSAEMLGWEQEGLDFAAWAVDSHDHAEDIVYGNLPKLIPVDQHADAHIAKCSDNNRIGNRMLHKHLVLGQSYQDAAAPVVEERLAMAGYRLAMILNDAAAHQN